MLKKIFKRHIFKPKTRKIIIGTSIGFLTAATITLGVTTGVIYNKAIEAKDGLSNFVILEDNYSAVQKQKLNVLALGDSLTAGYNKKANAQNKAENSSFISYADIVAKGLDNAGKLASYTNLAVSGKTTDSLVDQIKTQANLKKIQNTDLIIFSIGGNDIMRAIKFLGLPFDTGLLGGETNGAFDRMLGTVNRSDEQDRMFSNIKPASIGSMLAGLISDHLSAALDGSLDQVVSPQLERFDDQTLFTKLVDIFRRQLLTIMHDVRDINKHARIIFVQAANPFMNWPDKFLNQKNLHWVLNGEETLVSVKDVYNYYNDAVAAIWKKGREDHVYVDSGMELVEISKIPEFVNNRYTSQPFITDIHPSLVGHERIGSYILNKFWNLTNPVDISPYVGDYKKYECDGDESVQLQCMWNADSIGSTGDWDDLKNHQNVYFQSMVLPIFHGLNWNGKEFRIPTPSSGTVDDKYYELDNPVGKLITVLNELMEVLGVSSTSSDEMSPDNSLVSSDESNNEMEIIAAQVLGGIGYDNDNHKINNFAVWMYYHLWMMMKAGDNKLPLWDYEKEEYKSSNNESQWSGNDWWSKLQTGIQTIFSGKGSIVKAGLMIFKGSMFTPLTKTNIDQLILLIKEKYDVDITKEDLSNIKSNFFNKIPEPTE